MHSFDVDPSALADAATELAAVSQALRAIDVAGPLGRISEALPGSATAAAAFFTSTKLGAATQVYAGRVQDLADTARDTAAAYVAVDRSVAERMCEPQR